MNALVIPYTTREKYEIEKIFTIWSIYIPCTKKNIKSFDIIFCNNKDMDEHLRKYIISLYDKYKLNKYFENIKFIWAKLTEEQDLYTTKPSNTSGPNNMFYF